MSDFAAAVRIADARTIVSVSGDTAPPSISIHRQWTGHILHCRIANLGPHPIRIHELIALDIPHTLPDDTPLLAEGFGMTNLTAGTIGHPRDLGEPDRLYDRRTPRDVHVAYGMLLLGPTAAGESHLLGFSSCHRFVGRFYLSPGRIQVGFDCEDLFLEPGESWEMDEFIQLSGPDPAQLLRDFALRIEHHHPRLRLSPDAPPTGWCSWYSVGPSVSADFVRSNLDTISSRFRQLRFIQIDDGYQPFMGDWLSTGPAFGGDIRGLLDTIRSRGFEPAIWVAPFVASAGSQLFREHPDWFLRDFAGDLVTSAVLWRDAWRQSPWFILDTSHPDACHYLHHVFKTMRHEWGVSYFKLDANSWGAAPGRRHDPLATRVQAFRKGMQAILSAVGPGAFVLGCNSPNWPSFGLIHGNRTSFDIGRDFHAFQVTASLHLRRNWQNGRLWWSDPDCLLLTGSAPSHEIEFHATAIFCAGGMLLSGDDLASLPGHRAAMLQKLLSLPRSAARFDDEHLRVGRIEQEGRRFVAVLNWDPAPVQIAIPLDAAACFHDIWRDQNLGWHESVLPLEVPGHGGRLLELKNSD